MNDFILMACSKDITRINLTKPYRDLTQWVACDGHRLHIKKDYPVDKPFSLAGSDIHYPNYSLCIPHHAPSAHTEIIIDTLRVKELKHLVKIAKAADSRKNIYATLAQNGQVHLTLQIKAEQLSIQSEINYQLPCIEWQGTLTMTGINIKYFAEALIGMYNELSLHHISVSLAFHQPIDEKGKISHGPVILSCDDLQAVIMPMRINE